MGNRKENMLMQEFIQSSLDYIEQNLKTDITADELAQMAGYSVGHYYRLFSQTTNSSIAGYILKRRLDHALIEISSGRKAIDVVLEYGFDTYAGFYKAFVKIYGCSPTKYLQIYYKSEVLFMQNKSEKELRNVLMNWDISADLTIKEISQSEWKIWQIGDEYYLKTNERSKMIKNIKIAKALYREGLTSEFLPIQTKSGEDYLDGEHIFLLTRKIGEPLNNRPLSDDEVGHLEHNKEREKNSYQLGQGIARLHNALKSVQDEIKPDEMNLYQQGLNAIQKIKQYAQKYNLDIKDDFYADYIETFGKLYDKLPKQLIHGNPTGDSAIYDENGEIVCFKGFEIYNISHIRLFDIVYSAGEINTKPDIDLYLNILKGIIKGYDSINPLIKEEIESVYYVLCSIGMNMIVYCDEILDVTKRNVKALVFLANNKEKFIDISLTL